MKKGNKTRQRKYSKKQQNKMKRLKINRNKKSKRRLKQQAMTEFLTKEGNRGYAPAKSFREAIEELKSKLR